MHPVKGEYPRTDQPLVREYNMDQHPTHTPDPITAAWYAYLDRRGGQSWWDHTKGDDD